MPQEQPGCINEFPLTEKLAKALIKDLACRHSSRIKLSKHARQRMQERGVTIQQLFNILKSNSSRFEELPYQTPAGDWQMNLEGIAAGELIRIALVLRRIESDPSAFIITVIVP